MIILSSTTDKIQVFLTSTVSTTELSCMSVYRDSGTNSITPLRNVVATNSKSLVDLVGSPSSSVSRIVDYISIFNRDTQSADVNLEFSDNGTNYTLSKCRIAPNEKMEYHDGNGFRVISNNGSIKTETFFDILNQTDFSSFILQQDVIHTAPTDNSHISVPAMKFSVNSGKRYWFRFFLVYTADATTTGSKWILEGPSSTSLLSFSVFTSLTTTSQTSALGAVQWEHITTANATSAATTGNTTYIEGFAAPDADGEIYVKFGAEVTNGTITLKKGSLIQYRLTL